MPSETHQTDVLTLPLRAGGRPTTSLGMPHSQVDQNSPVEVFDALASWLFSLPHVRTERMELMARLREPTQTFESGRIVVYRLDKNYKVTHDWAETRYSLVLVFDSDDVLERHGLVQVR